ncbi:carboxypeptidase-like regulatory domain-containing protein [Aquimarina sp. D1M17]|uniref:TonB-dependent receptor n=1 Tax=Aquimarina acroporae TaxID=2937283 RepID=UPI0020BFFF24|nr:TonB-dependent receptor [Aquimarina acroporae]MCK8523678.1 carboxypeptidase-like regulatory domain-containing protein [Aquimarina acroporae]
MVYHASIKLFVLALLLVTFWSTAQETKIKGRIVDEFTGENILEVTVSIQDSEISMQTNSFGVFTFTGKLLPLGEQILVLSKPGYISKRFPIVINEGQVLDLDVLKMQYDFSTEQDQIATIIIADQDLEEENDVSFNSSALLLANRDVFLNAAAYDFGTTFFKPRGLNNENGKVLINGIEMNKLSHGRPVWSNWGGLNDVQRNQEFSFGLAANEYSFGDLLGTSNLIMRASKYRKGYRISYASSNRSYQGRVMGTYHSGLSSKGWAYSVSLSRRFGEEGFVEGTGYEANSFFVSIEKKLSNQHSLNITGIYTPNRRGRSTAITQEVFDIKGASYNPNWGYQNGKIRNARERRVDEPIIMLNHYWNISKETYLSTNLAFQKGIVGNSRIDTGGGDLVTTANGQTFYTGGGRSSDTNPVHPDNLPSSYLKDTNPTAFDYQNAFLAQQNLTNNGQIEWEQLIQTNQQNNILGKNATYILLEDRTDDTQVTGSIILNSKISKKIRLNSSISYKSLSSQNFAEVKDLLGGTGFLDVDLFAQSSNNLNNTERQNRSQSDLQNPNRIVKTGDRYDYNYNINASVLGGYIQSQFDFNTVNFFVAGNFSQTSYQREGFYENGYYPGNQSLGKSTSLNFQNYGVKTGATIRVYGLHTIHLNAGYFNKAPTFQNTFVNARQNNLTVGELLENEQESETIETVDASYIYRTERIKARLTGYYTNVKDATNISFFYTQAISGSQSGFVQEILTDIDKLHFGGELGISYRITPSLKLKSAVAVGNFRYQNNPELALTSTSDVFSDVQGVKLLGKSFLKNYYISGGPQNAAQLGFEYRDPNFWWFGATVNHFSNIFINVSPFARTTNFYQDSDGLPFTDYDENIARKLLEQERFDDYFLVNAIGGKSWRIKKYTIGFFASVNNILNQTYKTGGFEQSRNANYRLALEESQRQTPVFGPKYFFGYGASYYANIYLRF